MDLNYYELRTFAAGEKVQFLDDDKIFIIASVKGSEITLKDGRKVDSRELTLC